MIYLTYQDIQGKFELILQNIQHFTSIYCDIFIKKGGICQFLEDYQATPIDLYA